MLLLRAPLVCLQVHHRRSFVSFAEFIQNRRFETFPELLHRWHKILLFFRLQICAPYLLLSCWAQSADESFGTSTLCPPSCSSNRNYDTGFKLDWDEIKPICTVAWLSVLAEHTRCAFYVWSRLCVRVESKWWAIPLSKCVNLSTSAAYFLLGASDVC